jgi:hypothetical protein
VVLEDKQHEYIEIELITLNLNAPESLNLTSYPRPASAAVPLIKVIHDMQQRTDKE